MVNALEVNPNDLIEKAARQLEEQKMVSPPEWAGYVKTGIHAERPPVKGDWWYTRSAAVLRSIYKLGPIGTSKLRTKYGGKKNRGYKPEKFYKGSGAVIRNVLQQLEKAGLVIQEKKNKKNGRTITPKGISLLDKIAVQLLKGTGKKNVEAEPKKELKEDQKKSEKKEVKVQELIKEEKSNE